MKSAKKPVKKVIKKTKVAAPKKVKKPVKKVATLAKGIDIVEKDDGSYVISGKNAKALEGATVERRERQYKFDERLVPYYLGGDTKEGNTALRDALIKLGKTPQMTELFLALKAGNLAYREESKETFVKALFTIINSHDTIGLAHVYEEDIQAIHSHNLKTFNDFWDGKNKLSAGVDEEFDGFSN